MVTPAEAKGLKAEADVETQIKKQIGDSLREIVHVPDPPAGATPEQEAARNAKIKQRDSFFLLTGENAESYKDAASREASIQRLTQQAITQGQLGNAGLNQIALQGGGTMADLVPDEEELEAIKRAAKKATTRQTDGMFGTTFGNLIAGILQWIVGMFTGDFKWPGQAIAEVTAGKIKEDMASDLAGLKPRLRDAVLSQVEGTVLTVAGYPPKQGATTAMPKPAIDEAATLKAFVRSKLEEDLGALPELRNNAAKKKAVLDAMTDVLASEVSAANADTAKTPKEIYESAYKNLKDALADKGLPEATRDAVAMVAAHETMQAVRERAVIEGVTNIVNIMKAVAKGKDGKLALDALPEEQRSVTTAFFEKQAADAIEAQLSSPDAAKVINALSFAHSGNKGNAAAYRQALVRASAEIVTDVSLNSTSTLAPEALQEHILQQLSEKKLNGKPLIADNDARKQFAAALAQGIASAHDPEKKEAAPAAVNLAEVQQKTKAKLADTLTKELKPAEIEARIRDAINKKTVMGGYLSASNKFSRFTKYSPAENDYSPMAKALQEEIQSFVPEIAAKHILAHGKLGESFYGEVEETLKKNLKARIDKGELSSAWNNNSANDNLDQLVKETMGDLRKKVDGFEGDKALASASPAMDAARAKAGNMKLPEVDQPKPESVKPAIAYNPTTGNLTPGEQGAPSVAAFTTRNPIAAATQARVS